MFPDRPQGVANSAYILATMLFELPPRPKLDENDENTSPFPRIVRAAHVTWDDREQRPAFRGLFRWATWLAGLAPEVRSSYASVITDANAALAGRTPECEAALARAKDQAAHLGDHRTLARTLLEFGKAELRNGAPERAAQCFRDAVAAAQLAGDPIEGYVIAFRAANQLVL